MTTILIIDDEAALRSNIADILASEGYTTLEADNGRDGLQQAQQHLPDLILCDVLMPEIDGYTVLQQLQAQAATATIPFIFMSAKVDKSSLQRGIELGADVYLTKPFTVSRLLEVVQSQLG